MPAIAAPIPPETVRVPVDFSLKDPTFVCWQGSSQEFLRYYPPESEEDEDHPLRHHIYARVRIPGG